MWLKKMLSEGRGFVASFRTENEQAKPRFPLQLVNAKVGFTRHFWIWLREKSEPPKALFLDNSGKISIKFFRKPKKIKKKRLALQF